MSSQKLHSGYKAPLIILVFHSTIQCYNVPLVTTMKILFSIFSFAV